MARIPASLYPLGEEIDYTRLLTRLYTEWWNASTTELKTALSFIRDAAWSDSIFERIGKAWPELVEKSKPLIERIMKRVSDKNFIRWSKQVEAATNKRVILALNPFHSEPWLDLFMSERVAENVRLIKDIGTQSASKMQQILEDGIRSGKSTRELVKELQTTFDYGKKRAKLIARDQIGKHNGLLNELRQKNAGVDEYIWSTSKDERVRSTHRVREGQTFKWSDPPSDGHPGQSIQCRCSALPVFPENIFETLVNSENRNL
jgi:SPP1 gp7 family putative phage head morphogenesis protein